MCCHRKDFPSEVETTGLVRIPEVGKKGWESETSAQLSSHQMSLWELRDHRDNSFTGRAHPRNEELFTLPGDLSWGLLSHSTAFSPKAPQAPCHSPGCHNSACAWNHLLSLNLHFLLKGKVGMGVFALPTSQNICDEMLYAKTLWKGYKPMKIVGGIITC